MAGWNPFQNPDPEVNPILALYAFRNKMLRNCYFEIGKKNLNVAYFKRSIKIFINLKFFFAKI
jgi:hypothetical protein